MANNHLSQHRATCQKSFKIFYTFDELNVDYHLLLKKLNYAFIFKSFVLTIARQIVK